MTTSPSTSQQHTVSTGDADRITTDIAVGVPVLERTGKLQTFLLSVPEWVDRVVVADNGEIDADREAVYDAPYPFDLDVLDLPYDVGIGHCRLAVAEATASEYLVVADNDMELPPNLGVLVEILERDPALGGVGGILDEYGSLRAGCCDFRAADWWGDGTALVQEVAPEKTTAVEWTTGHPVARFDKLANAMVVRRAAIVDYGWDGDLVDKEHLDFFVGHWRETDWEFGVCPEVVFRHHTGGPPTYQQQFRYANTERQRRAREEFCDKWGFDRVVLGDTRWFGTGRRPLPEQLANTLIRQVPIRYSLPVKDAAKRVLL